MQWLVTRHSGPTPRVVLIKAQTKAHPSSPGGEDANGATHIQNADWAEQNSATAQTPTPARTDEAKATPGSGRRNNRPGRTRQPAGTTRGPLETTQGPVNPNPNPNPNVVL